MMNLIDELQFLELIMMIEYTGSFDNKNMQQFDDIKSALTRSQLSGAGKLTTVHWKHLRTRTFMINLIYELQLLDLIMMIEDNNRVKLLIFCFQRK